MDEEVIESEVSPENTPDTGQPKKRRRGVRHDSEYHRNVIKQARTAGTGYVNYRGINISAKEMGPPCK